MRRGARSAAPSRGPSHARGPRVCLTGRDVAKLDAVAEDIVAGGGVAETARVDALDEHAVAEHLDAVVERAGAVVISLNAIGSGPTLDRTPLTEMAGDAFARPIAFYTSSNFITATAAARHMSGRGSGAILTLTSGSPPSPRSPTPPPSSPPTAPAP